MLAFADMLIGDKTTLPSKDYAKTQGCKSMIWDDWESFDLY